MVLRPCAVGNVRAEMPLTSWSATFPNRADVHVSQLHFRVPVALPPAGHQVGGPTPATQVVVALTELRFTPGGLASLAPRWSQSSMSYTGWVWTL
jgi:hypothetical protein